MSTDFIGGVSYLLLVTMWNPAPGSTDLSGEVLSLAKPIDQNDHSFLVDITEFHAAILRQDRQFFIIGGHCIKPHLVQRIQLVMTYVELND